MKFSVNTKELKKVLSLHKKGKTKSGVAFILEGINIKADRSGIDIYSTDLEVSLISKMKGGVIDRPGIITIPFKVLENTINFTDTDMVQFEIIEPKKCKVDKMVINTMDTNEFPKVPIISADITVTDLDFKDFFNSVSNIIKMVSKDETRGILSGVLLNTRDNEIVGTNSYDIGISAFNFKADMGEFVILGRLYDLFKQIDKVTTLDKMTIFKENGQVSFKIGDNRIISRILSGKFPEYQKLMPGNSFNYDYKFNCKDMIKILDKGNKLIKDDVPVTFTFNVDKLNISKTDKGIGEYKDSIKVENLRSNGELKMGFNPYFFKDCIENFESVHILLDEPLRPVAFRNNNSLKYLLMPIRVE